MMPSNERAVAELLASRAHPPAPAPDAKAKIWRAIEQRARPALCAARSTKIGVLALALVIAGVAAAQLARAPAPTESVAPAPATTEIGAAVPVAPAPTPSPPAAPRIAPPPAVPAAPGVARPSRPAGHRAPPVEHEVRVATAPEDPELAAYKDARAAMREDLAAGLARLSAYLVSFPDGRFDVEARLSIIECQVRLGRLADAEPVVEAFLARHPDNERVGEVRFVRAEIQRQVYARCDRALPDYRAAATSSRVGDDAQFFRGWCADQTGDRSERDDALGDYLARWPTGRHANSARSLMVRQP